MLHGPGLTQAALQDQPAHGLAEFFRLDHIGVAGVLGYRGDRQQQA